MSDEQPMDAPALPKGKSLTGFYVAIGIVAALVGLGALVYQLGLCYAIYRVKHAPQLYSPPFYSRAVADKWLLVCLDAARRGNREAIEVIIDHVGVCTPSWLEREEAGMSGPDVAYLAAEAQPERFFEALGRRDKREALKVLEAVENGSYGDAGFRYSKEGLTLEAGLARSLGLLAGSAEDAKSRRVAQAAFDFMRCRFAQELAEAEGTEKAGTEP